jgi:capsular polysaccharide export protein
MQLDAEKDLLQRLALAGWRPGDAVQTLGFSMRKRRMLLAWLRAWPQAQLPSAVDVSSTDASPAGASHALPSYVWGAAPKTSGDQPRCMIRVEDGMLRSVGLGADLVAPISWVFDTQGMYFDATGPSDLEHILKTRQFSEYDKAQAQALRQSLVALKVTKYNLRGKAWQRPRTSKQVVLVAGQVESDASVQLGCTTVRSNTELLRQARLMRPDAHLVYKPHPDVVALLRAGAVSNAQEPLWDELVTDASIEAIYAQVDELHVMSSLAGFEALLRGLKVVCHGMPFYAGWGLCEAPNLTPQVLARRGRALSVDELVFGVLLDYASYRSPSDGSIWTAQQAVQWLSHQATSAPQPSWLKRRLLALLAKLQGRF